MFIEGKNQCTEESLYESLMLNDGAGSRPKSICHIIAFEAKATLGSSKKWSEGLEGVKNAEEKLKNHGLGIPMTNWRGQL